MDEEVVTELIQEKLNHENLKIELAKLLDINHRANLLEKYNILEQKLGGEGASKNTAELILENIFYK